ncbi:MULTISPECIES: Imm50 family immunity protein [unclassified Streptomyces]|uniref:Imm50 family immunity protein n=1 Tax=unclassified Streptomyces TaxID=2593676 RepID=UPI002E809B24|nr:Imm50 family immunity protein [Streptomyces sp. NBC_00589]WTI38836.1 immunity 50 family protein [Streptomyces sp. NBC_00775]WUB27484.1 immunity 50 family protein [Streptomyces sp. NBC_00589]
MSADWLQLLASAEYLGGLYDGAPPAHDVCDLFYVHIDERENSVTLGFDTRRLPSNPPAEWVEKGLNAFEFYLVFAEVEGLQVTGWGAAEAKEIHLATHGGAFFEVVLGSEGSGIAFRAATARLAKWRGYLASDSP